MLGLRAVGTRLRLVVITAFDQIMTLRLLMNIVFSNVNVYQFQARKTC